jgi:hypothetical protein
MSLSHERTARRLYFLHPKFCNLLARKGDHLAEYYNYSQAKPAKRPAKTAVAKSLDCLHRRSMLWLEAGLVVVS